MSASTSDSSQMPSLLRLQNVLIIVFVIALGVFLRIISAYGGHNFDVDSYRIVADIVARGGNVYQETSRYNYGPVWFLILHCIDLFNIEKLEWTHNFRLKITVFLTCIDFGILLFLLKRYSINIGALFFLNPISIIITGYHSQFDNLAILIGFISMIIYTKSDSPSRKIGSLILIGLSLTTKHLLFLFPVWLALKEKRLKEVILVICIPYIIFLGAFYPYYAEGSSGILNNVFLYKSFNNAPFWAIFSPYIIFNFFPRTILMVVALLIVGFLIRKRTALESLHIYLVSLVVFSSAIANQYLAIPIASIAVFWNLGYGMYSTVGSLYLLVEKDGLHLEFLQEIINWKGGYGYYVLIPLLAIGLYLNFTSTKLFDLICKIWKEFVIKIKKGI